MMKFYLILLPIFILALIQGAVLPLNLVLLVVLFYAAFNSGKESLLVSFFSGLILDLAKGISLGLSSLLFLVFSFMLVLYSRRFDASHPVFLALFVLLAGLGYGRVVNGLINWQESLSLSILALLIIVILRYFWGETKGGIKLKTSL